MTDDARPHADAPIDRGDEILHVISGAILLDLLFAQTSGGEADPETQIPDTRSETSRGAVMRVIFG